MRAGLATRSAPLSVRRRSRGGGVPGGRWALALLLAGVAGAAQAQPPGEAQAEEDDGEGGPEDPEAARLARKHFREGMRLFRKHAYREAIREFHVAADEVPSADLWFNIARAHEELSEYERAVEFYRRYLRDRVDPPDREKIEKRIEELKERAEAKRRAEERKPSTGTLRVRSDQEGAAIRVGERDIGRAPVSVPLSLEPGKHRLAMQKEGYIPFRARVTVAAGSMTGAYGTLQQATTYRAVRSDRIWTWITGGLAVAALGTSLGLGVKATTLNEPATREQARDWAAYSDYALGAGLALGVTAGILWFVEGRAVGTEKQ